MNDHLFLLWIGFVTGAVFVLPPFDWAASIILRRGTQRIDSVALRERANVALLLAFATSINAAIAANRIFNLHIDNTVIVFLLTIEMLVIGIPNLVWLGLYVIRRRRRKD